MELDSWLFRTLEIFKNKSKNKFIAGKIQIHSHSFNLDAKTQSRWVLITYITLGCEITQSSCPWLKNFSYLNSLMVLTVAVAVIKWQL